MNTVGKWWMWLGFLIFILTVLIIDICLLEKRKTALPLRQAIFWVLTWGSCALLFNVALWLQLFLVKGIVIANQKALEFLTGYIVEQSLSIDNLFVFILIFSFFHVPPNLHRRVLLYGVLSAIIFRFSVIFSGTFLINQFHWILYVFGVFLIFSGIKLLLVEEHEKDLEKNLALRFLRKFLRLTKKYHDEKFFVRVKKIWYATPLFLVLIMIEMSDLIFAVDSIPAVFSITHDPFIVFTSNIFAVLGLRALYFVLAHMKKTFHLLKVGIAIVLTFVGSKMLIEYWYKVPTLYMLIIILFTLSMSVILSLFLSKNKKHSIK